MAAAPIMPRVWPELCQLHRPLVLRRERPGAELPRARDRAAGRPPPRPRRRSRTRRDRRCWRGSLKGDPDGGARPRHHPAPAHPRRARELGDRPPAIGPSASAFPSAESGSRSAASLPAFAIAVPEASASTQPWFGQVALAGRAVLLDHDVPELARRRRSSRGRPRLQDEPAADSSADGQHHHVAAPLARRRRGTRRGRRRSRRCRRTPGSPTRSCIRSRIGTSVIVRLTAWIGDAAIVVDGGGMPRPAAQHVRGAPPLPPSAPRSSSSISLSSLSPVEGSLPWYSDLLIRSRRPRPPSSSPEVDADGLLRRHGPVRILDGSRCQAGSDGMRKY